MKKKRFSCFGRPSFLSFSSFSDNHYTGKICQKWLRKKKISPSQLWYTITKRIFLTATPVKGCVNKGTISLAPEYTHMYGQRNELITETYLDPPIVLNPFTLRIRPIPVWNKFDKDEFQKRKLILSTHFPEDLPWVSRLLKWLTLEIRKI